MEAIEATLRLFTAMANFVGLLLDWRMWAVIGGGIFGAKLWGAIAEGRKMARPVERTKQERGWEHQELEIEERQVRVEAFRARRAEFERRKGSGPGEGTVAEVEAQPPPDTGPERLAASLVHPGSDPTAPLRRGEANHIRHHQPQEPTVRESGASPDLGVVGGRSLPCQPPCSTRSRLAHDHSSNGSGATTSDGSRAVSAPGAATDGIIDPARPSYGLPAASQGFPVTDSPDSGGGGVSKV